jgi:Nucleoside-diphosphate-sugar epimerases
LGLETQATKEAVKGCQVAYLTVGLPYRAALWEKQWPQIMANVLNACAEADCRLVFFDNIYMYRCRGMADMTEDQPLDPCSRKGKVRLAIADQLLSAHQRGEVKALIARSADFYGPGIAQTSILNETIIKPIATGKATQWLGDLDQPHSFTYVSDAAQAIYALASDAQYFGQVWHLPTLNPGPSARQWAEMAAQALQQPARIKRVPPLALKLASLFSPILRELKEMAYQYEQAYGFNSQKIEKALGLQPTPYQEGLLAALRADYPERFASH